MTEKQFYDWQTLAVNHWAAEPMATADVDLVIATDRIDETVAALETAHFSAKRFEWSINLAGTSKLSIQISTEAIYQEFPQRSIATEVHGILMRVACKEDVIVGKTLAYQDTSRRPSKRTKDLLDIVRLVEAHPALKNNLPVEIAQKVTAIENGNV